MQNCLDGNFIYTIIILRYIVRKGAENIADFLSRIRHEESSNNFITKILPTNIAILLFRKQYLRRCHWQKYRNTQN